MASILEYFNNDFKEMSLDQTLNLSEVSKVDGKIIKNIEVKQRIRQDLNSSARMFTYYIPNVNNTFSICLSVLNEIERLKKEANDIVAIGDFTNDLSVGLHKFVYSNRIYIYTENQLNKGELIELDKYCKSKNLFVTIRSNNYKNKRMKLEKPMAFISHDSKDKDLIARKLASSLSSRLCAVWYDEYSLKVGDSLRESIEKGIIEAKKCILVLTPNFLANPGWGKKEFNSIFTREMILEERIILPIWYNVTAKDVYEYSPSLADTFALNWPNPENFDENEYNVQVEQIVSKIHTEITSVNKT